MEVHEFAHLVAEGAGPDRSAFLSAYFTLVGTHGLHVTAGLIWMAIMMHQVRAFRPRWRHAPTDGLPQPVLALPRPGLDLRFHLRLSARGALMSRPYFVHPAGHATHGSLKILRVGFVLSLGLTVLSFGGGDGRLVPHAMILPAIIFSRWPSCWCSLIFFLHLGTAPGAARTTCAIGLLTGLIIFIVVAGSLWVMHNANVNMMPTQMSVERALSKD